MPRFAALVAFTVVLLTPPARAQEPAPRLRIAYQFRADSPATHLGDVTIRVTGRLDDTTRFQLPAWYPGRYAIYNFAANVQEVNARCDGRTVPAPKRDKQTWAVACAPGTGDHRVELRYRVWWNTLSGSHAQIDARHINLNPGGIFAYVVGHKPDSVTVEYAGPTGWRVVNGAVRDPVPGPVTLAFPNYDVFIDHPTEISDRFTVDSFRVGAVPYRVVVHAEGEGRDDATARTGLVDAVRRIVAAEVALWGDPPLDGYTFLFHFLPDQDRGDGMEHLTSTQIIERSSVRRFADDFEGIAHEFFHTWNMKRLRARELGPWDYSRENPTTLLWVGEGITNYYGARSVYRAGLEDRAAYLNRVADAVATLQSRPGRFLMSVRQSSFNAWFFDRAPLYQETNLRNTTISYYNKGELLGWLLDLEIRAATGGAKTLDDVMRQLWERCWKAPNATYYLQGRGYTEDDVLQVVNEVAGRDFSDFFARYVGGTEELPYAATLAKVGLALRHDASGYHLDPLDGVPAGVRRLGEAWMAGR